MLKDRFTEHQGYVRNKDLSKATGFHFNSAGHSLSDMHINALEHLEHLEKSEKQCTSTKATPNIMASTKSPEQLLIAKKKFLNKNILHIHII